MEPGPHQTPAQPTHMQQNAVNNEGGAPPTKKAQAVAREAAMLNTFACRDTPDNHSIPQRTEEATEDGARRATLAYVSRHTRIKIILRSYAYTIFMIASHSY